MRSVIRRAAPVATLAAGVVLAAVPAHAAAQATADCALPPEGVPLKTEGRTPIFLNACGQPYQAGYRLEGTTLHFPGGGEHALPQETEAEAERILRAAYGLVGPREALVRTVWPE